MSFCPTRKIKYDDPEDAAEAARIDRIIAAIKKKRDDEERAEMEGDLRVARQLARKRKRDEELEQRKKEEELEQREKEKEIQRKKEKLEQRKKGKEIQCYGLEYDAELLEELRRDKEHDIKPTVWK